jgi:hypothetical protein
MRSRRRLRRDEAHLVDEVQAFLDGNYLEHVARVGSRPPPWAAMNAAAHGDLARLSESVEGAPELSSAAHLTPEHLGCATAARAIARELLRVVEDDEELLVYLQGTVLIPFELALIAECGRTRVTALEIVASTRELLRLASP